MRCVRSICIEKESKMKGKYSESMPLYAALLAVGAAAAVVTFILVLNNAGGQVQLPVQTTDASASQTTPADPNTYVPGEQTSEEMKDAAIELLSGNYEVLRLFYTRGLEHKDEPYGNAPEDGYYTVSDGEYASFAQLEELVNGIFCEEQAKITLENSLGYGAIYSERYNGSLGIIANFTPMEYDISWENPDFSIDPVSDEECALVITLKNRDSGEEISRSGEMIKTEKGWRLKSIIF